MTAITFSHDSFTSGPVTGKLDLLPSDCF